MSKSAIWMRPPSYWLARPTRPGRALARGRFGLLDGAQDAETCKARGKRVPPRRAASDPHRDRPGSCIAEAGPTPRRARTLGCLCRVAPVAPPPRPRWPGPTIRLPRPLCRPYGGAVVKGQGLMAIVLVVVVGVNVVAACGAVRVSAGSRRWSCSYSGAGPRPLFVARPLSKVERGRRGAGGCSGDKSLSCCAPGMLGPPREPQRGVSKGVSVSWCDERRFLRPSSSPIDGLTLPKPFTSKPGDPSLPRRELAAGRDGGALAALLDLARAAKTTTTARRRPAKQRIRPSVRACAKRSLGRRRSCKTGAWTSSPPTGPGAPCTHKRLTVRTGPPIPARSVSLDPRSTDSYLDWEHVANDIVAILRSEAGPDAHHRGLSDLVGELSTRSETFRTRWPRNTSVSKTPALSASTTPSSAT